VTAFPEEFISDADLVIAAKKGLYDRSRLLTPEATMGAIQDLKHWIGQEIAFEEGASASFGRMLSELWHSEYLDQLPPLLNRFERLVSAYFVRRGSVPAFHGFCNAWRDGVLRRILQFAEEEPEHDDQGHAPAPFALLASGSLGRREQTLEEGERYFLLWNGGAAEAEYFKAFAYRVIAILDHFGLIARESPAQLGKALWRGTLEDWDGYLAGESLTPGHPDLLETMSDLRQLCGDQEIGSRALRQARSSLARCGGSGAFQDLAREVVEVPVALGLLGGIRVEKSGEYAGYCNPEQGGLYPLVRAVRLLAAQSDLEPGPTLDRLVALGSLGILEEEQVERLSVSYHVLSGLKVRREIALQHPYLDPATLAESEREKLKSALESVRQLQRFLRCIFLGKDRVPLVV
jgi:CBS domain-containing protein